MPTQTASKMLIAFAAGLCQTVHAADCTQAFINADSGRSDLHIELPILPNEMLTGEFGAGKFSGKVGRLKKKRCMVYVIHHGYGRNSYLSSLLRILALVRLSRIVMFSNGLGRE